MPEFQSGEKKGKNYAETAFGRAVWAIEKKTKKGTAPLWNISEQSQNVSLVVAE